MTTIGTSMTPTWCAGSWAVVGPHRHPEVPCLVRALGPLPWTTWAAQGTSPSCGAARTEAGTRTTATTGRTPASSAQVGLTRGGSPFRGATDSVRTDQIPTVVPPPQPGSVRPYSRGAATGPDCRAAGTQGFVPAALVERGGLSNRTLAVPRNCPQLVGGDLWHPALAQGQGS